LSAVSDDYRQEPRASDADREASVLVLRDATVEGRLTLDEFGERVGRAQVARTQAELMVLTGDLPRPAPAPAVEPSHVAFCSRLERRGAWRLPERSSFRSIFGTVTVIVPAGATVDVSGGGLFASQVIDPPAASPVEGAPVLRLHVSGPGGTLRVRQRDESSALRRLLGER
jgi:DUF1707 SHOCT-like domain